MPNGCQKCWQEFKGWLNAFTPLETFLTILEAVLLVVLIFFIVFMILHFLACHVSVHSESQTVRPTTQTSKIMTASADVSIATSSTIRKSRPTCTYTTVNNTLTTLPGANETIGSTSTTGTTQSTSDDEASNSPTDRTSDTYTTPNHPDEIEAIDSDGELADARESQAVLALVKVKPSGLTFGCILTVVADEWTVTAASCLDSIEEVDSLDNFVIIDRYDDLNKGRSHAVADVRVHPLYEGRNKSYDLALLRSAGLAREPVELPSLLDYFKLPMGEAGEILGFGKFRTIDQSEPQRVHTAAVHILPSSQCAPPDSMERHLIPLPPVEHGSCARGPLCLGVLHARGSPCNYCAGAPWVRGRVLLGVMADNEQCGAACEPAQYANVADARDWIELVIGS